MTFQTPSERAATGDVRLWLVMASEIAAQASFNFGTSNVACARLIRRKNPARFLWNIKPTAASHWCC